MRCQLLSFSCALIGVSWLQSAAASCFYPDGSLPTDNTYTQCTNDEFSMCCIVTDGNMCLSNGLCYSEMSNYMYRGACSDKTWNSTACFDYCRGGGDRWSSEREYDPLISCGDDKYCCFSDELTCCDDDSKVFTVPHASVVKELSSKTSGRPSFNPSTRTATKTGRTTGTSYAAPTGTKPVSTPNPKSQSTSVSTPESTPEGSSGVSKTAIIGGAAGAVAALLITIVLVFFLLRRRYQKKLASSVQTFPMSNDGFQKIPNHSDPDKAPIPVEYPAPVHSPAPPYQLPAPHGTVEMDNSGRAPMANQWGQPIYEAPAQPWRHELR